MRLGRYLAAMGLSMLLAMPVIAQTTSPSKAPSSPAATPSKPPAAATPTTADKPTGKSEQPGGLIDVNSATAEELTKLPGVGPARAQAIIANRPYNGKDDLTNRKILPPNIYNGIKDKIVARQAPSK